MELVSIVCPTYNRFEYTRQCFKALLENTENDYELIIWDNNSTEEGMQDWLREFADTHENTMFIECSENLGPSRTYRYLMEMANGEYICLMNNDIEVTENWLEEMLGVMGDLPEKSIVRPILIKPDDRVLNMGDKMIPLTEKVKLKVYNFLNRNKNEEFPDILECDQIGAAGSFMKADVLKYGKYRKDAFIELRDFDFNNQLKEHGYRVYATSRTHSYHLESEVANPYEQYEKMRKNPKIISPGLNQFYETWGWLPFRNFIEYTQIEDRQDLLREETAKIEKVVEGHEYADEVRIQLIKAYALLGNEEFLEKIGKHAGKIKDREKELKAWRFCSRQHLANNNYRYAQEALQEAVKIEPDTPVALGDWYHLARLARGELRDEALQVLESEKPLLAEKAQKNRIEY